MNDQARRKRIGRYAREACERLDPDLKSAHHGEDPLMSAGKRGVVSYFRPDTEIHTDPTRVIGRRTTCDSDEHPYLRGYEVVVIAVLKNALRSKVYDYLTTEDAVRAAGGVGPDDRVEVAAILPKEGLSFVTNDPKATDVEGLRGVARHGAGSKRRGKKR